MAACGEGVHSLLDEENKAVCFVAKSVAFLERWLPPISCFFKRDAASCSFAATGVWGSIQEQRTPLQQSSLHLELHISPLHFYFTWMLPTGGMAAHDMLRMFNKCVLCGPEQITTSNFQFIKTQN
jgi:hypothetical protein